MTTLTNVHSYIRPHLHETVDLEQYLLVDMESSHSVAVNIQVMRRTVTIYDDTTFLYSYVPSAVA